MNMKTTWLKWLILMVGISLLIAWCTKMNNETTHNDVDTTNTGTTAVVDTETGSAASYSTEEVAQHASQEDCWTIVNDNVYDVTSYAPRHPGWPEKIYAICGKDGSSLFESQHDGQPKPEMMLQKLLKWALSK